MSVNPGFGALAALLEDQAAEVAAGVGDDGAVEVVRGVVIAALQPHWRPTASQWECEDEGGCVPQIGDGDRLVADGDLDTIALYAVVAQVEQELKISVPDREVDAVVTVGELVEVCRAQC